jgi:hypothetical protein
MIGFDTSDWAGRGGWAGRGAWAAAVAVPAAAIVLMLKKNGYCSVSNMHEVNQNEVIDDKRASSVATSRISLIVFVLLKQHLMKHMVVR